MLSIEEILRTAKEAGASDVHLTVGIPPKMRVNGNLITMDYPKLLPVCFTDSCRIWYSHRNRKNKTAEQS